MPDAYIDQQALKQQLAGLFNTEKDKFAYFGSRVNQTFEAFVFASVIKWYQNHGWQTTFHHPMDPSTKQPTPKLKFSTRGRPDGYSYISAIKDGEEVEIRHQLRVSTVKHRDRNRHPANICLDVAVFRRMDLSCFKTYHAIPNDKLITFAEAKHMSAYAELLASFVGLVHELQPFRLKQVRIKTFSPSEHPAPFLYVSGMLYSTAQGLKETIERRKFDIDIYSNINQFTLGFK